MGDDCLIEANPDVAGIGVRTSVYLQAFISMINVAVRLIRNIQHSNQDGFIGEHKHAIAQRGARIALYTGVALILCGAIQAATSGIAPYHGLLIANLSGIVVMSTVPAYSLIFADFERSGHEERNINFRDKITKLMQSEDKDNKHNAQLFALHSLYLLGVASFSLWLFATLPSIDIHSPYCSRSTIYYAWGARVRFDSHGFRIFCLALFTLVAMPMLNIAIIISMVHFNVIMVTRVISRLSSRTARLLGHTDDSMPKHFEDVVAVIIALSFRCLLVILVIVATEGTIRINNVAPGESDWTLGQSLALFAAFSSVTDLWEYFRPEDPLEKKVVVVSWPKEQREDGRSVARLLAQRGASVICNPYQGRESDNNHESGNNHESSNTHEKGKKASVDRGEIFILRNGSSMPIQDICTFGIDNLGGVDHVILLATEQPSRGQPVANYLPSILTVKDKINGNGSLLFLTSIHSGSTPASLRSYCLYRLRPARAFGDNNMVQAVLRDLVGPPDPASPRSTVSTSLETLIAPNESEVSALSFSTKDGASWETDNRVLFMMQSSGWRSRRRYGKEMRVILSDIQN